MLVVEVEHVRDQVLQLAELVDLVVMVVEEMVV